MKNIIAQFPPKADLETSVDIPLNVRLWRDMHELLASLGFDLMEVGQDLVTLRTGKQANRRNCQFVLQALLALFGTIFCRGILFCKVLLLALTVILFSRYRKRCTEKPWLGFRQQLRIVERRPPRKFGQFRLHVPIRTRSTAQRFSCFDSEKSVATTTAISSCFNQLRWSIHVVCSTTR